MSREVTNFTVNAEVNLLPKSSQIQIWQEQKTITGCVFLTPEEALSHYQSAKRQLRFLTGGGIAALLIGSLGIPASAVIILRDAIAQNPDPSYALIALTFVSSVAALGSGFYTLEYTENQHLLTDRTIERVEEYIKKESEQANQISG
jgi:hypothetical protein